MRRLLTLVLASTLLVATACGSGGDDNSVDEADDGSPSSSPSSSPTSSPSSQEPSEEPSEESSPPPSDEPSQPVRHDDKNPTVATGKTWKGGSTCGLLSRQHFSAAGVTVPNPRGTPEDDGGCSVDATAPYAGVLYGVPPKGEGGEEWPDAKRTYYGLSGNTAYSACDGQVVCQFAVAIGGGRWATVILLLNNPSADQTAMVASGKRILARLFAELPAA